MELRKMIIYFVLVLLVLDPRSVDARGSRHHHNGGSKDQPKTRQNSEGSKDPNSPVTLSINDKYAIMENGDVQVTLSIPGGHVAGIKYAGIKNVLDYGRKEKSRGYWNVFWSTEYSNGEDWLDMENFKVITNSENKVELSFYTQWNANPNSIPINLDKRFVMLRGSSGFYNYVILDHDGSSPAISISQIRVAYKLPNIFNYMVVSDDIQKIMPKEEDYDNGQPLAYREAILYTNSSDPELRTAVEDKYQYTQDMKDQQVHGWISSSDDTPVGFWLIKPSTEFYSAGPFKQELTSHMGPVSLITFFGGHYVGQNLQLSLQEGEPWQKVVGPYFVYLNKATESASGDSYAQLWSDAKDQLQQEMDKWPYEFPSSELYVKANQRGSVGGQLSIRDSNEVNAASSAWVGLAAPGEVGSWQTETKGYQFWTQADHNGNFMIKGVHEGEYNLYAWVPGVLGEYKHDTNIQVLAGNNINLGEMVYEPPRNGPILWEIGIPDRTAAEFYVPDPRPEYVNSVLLKNNKNKYRQYGLWERYADLYPNEDLVYTVGESDYSKDWFFAHVTRRTGDDEFEAATWQIRFSIQDVNPYAKYTLRISLASASTAQIRVRFNNHTFSRPQFSTGKIGSDNAIARHGIHGLYWQFSFDVSGSLLSNGMNTLYLTQSVAANPFCGVMYDYLRLEGPSS